MRWGARLLVWYDLRFLPAAQTRKARRSRVLLQTLAGEVACFLALAKVACEKHNL